MDQVALESQDQESQPAILIPHAPPPLPPSTPQFFLLDHLDDSTHRTH